LGQFVELALSKDFIRSIEFHPMTFTGQNGIDFDRKAHYTTYDILRDLEKLTQGKIHISDFIPSPVAHPLCYSVTYVMKLKNGDWLPFPRFMKKQDLRQILAGSLYLEPGPELESIFTDVINDLWSGAIECNNSDLVLHSIKEISKRLFSPEKSEAARIHEAELTSKAIYVHSHMDDETFDTDRIRQCCVGIREPDGTNIPSCAYNVLYRSRDHRFTTNPESPMTNLGPGRF
jgi:tetraether lipid synthase